jgi:hypothetical protein
MLSTTGEVERETGLEPATFSLEGLGALAQWHRAQTGEHLVSSYRVVRRGIPCGLFANVMSPLPRPDLRLLGGRLSLARPRKRWSDQSSELVADDFVALAGRALEPDPIDDLNAPSPVDDQALLAQLRRHS